jgi:hypothetical protein
MQQLPTADEVRALVRPLDDRDRRVLGGLVLLMVREPARVRDQEWLAERFVEVAVVAHGFAADEEHATSEDVAVIEGYAKARMRLVVNAAVALFVRTADELRARGGSYSLADAHAVVRSYVGEG